MSKEIEAVVNASEIESKNVEVGEWGLNIKGQITQEEWLNVALSIQKFDGKLQWFLGDLAIYAESDVTGWDTKDKETGISKYDKMVAGTGYSRQTLAQYANVARRFKEDFRERICAHIRTDIISFTHFHFVASLNDEFAKYWLQKASDGEWGVAKLREEIRKWKEGRGELPERAERPIGIVTYKEQHDAFIRRFPPSHPEKEYDETTYLLEVYDGAKARLQELGIEL